MTQASTEVAPISLAARVAQIMVVAQANAAPSPPRTAIIDGQPNVALLELLRSSRSGDTAQMAGLVFDGESRVDERVDRLSPALEIMRGEKAFDRLSELIARHDA